MVEHMGNNVSQLFGLIWKRIGMVWKEFGLLAVTSGKLRLTMDHLRRKILEVTMNVPWLLTQNCVNSRYKYYGHLTVNRGEPTTSRRLTVVQHNNLTVTVTELCIFQGLFSDYLTANCRTDHG